VYKALTPNESKEEFISWLNTVDTYQIRCIVIVGGKNALRVTEAAQIVSSYYPHIILGGITIPERHRDREDEPSRLIEKSKAGLQFFTSQVVYNADNAISALREYDEHCKECYVEPARIIFTFAPFCSDNTVQFLRWLGVEVPHGTVRRVLSRKDAHARAAESVEVCWENWKRILDATRRLMISVPIGFSVESVTKSKVELDAAIRLYKELKNAMEMRV